MVSTTSPSEKPGLRRTIVTTVLVTLLIVCVIAFFATIGYRSRHRLATRGMPGPVSGMGVGSATAPPLPTAARQALDSANTAYRAKAYPLALAEYRAAAAAAPNEAAPYFGIVMAATALHEPAVADSASAVIRTLTQSGGQMLSDSALRQLHTAPRGHPPLLSGAHPQT
jgi:hypothetical protein